MGFLERRKITKPPWSSPSRLSQPGSTGSMNYRVVILAAACFAVQISAMLNIPKKCGVGKFQLEAYLEKKKQSTRISQVKQSCADVERAMLDGLKLARAPIESLASEESELKKDPDLHMFVKLCHAQPFSSPIHQRAFTKKFDELLAQVSQEQANKALGLLIPFVTADKPYLFQRVKEILEQNRWVGGGGKQVSCRASHGWQMYRVIFERERFI